MADEDPVLFSATSSYENDNADIPITGFSDADFAKSVEEQRKSTSGYAFFAWGNLVSYKSKLQPLTAGSTHEAELIALSFAADEGVWLRRLLKEIRFATNKSTKPSHFVFPQKATKANNHRARDLEHHLDNMPPTPIMIDNKGTHATVNNPMSTAHASRHLDVRFFRVRDHIREKKKLRVHFVRTHLNVSDFFTKALPTTAFNNFRRILMGDIARNY